MSDHNTIVKNFVRSLRPLLYEQKGAAEIMVVYESVTMGIMLLLKDIYDIKPNVAVEYVETAVHEATRRFAKENNRGPTQ